LKRGAGTAQLRVGFVGFGDINERRKVGERKTDGCDRPELKFARDRAPGCFVINQRVVQSISRMVIP